ncbi:MAG: hypothetical protein MJZ32_03560 [Bacteroidaceae bacterium]|nr:hypothetical protein [Bacteroidaceae bacterium]
MKKFLSKIMFATVAIISATGFTSCNNADDPIVPEQAAAQEKPDKSNAVPAYGVVLSDNILDMYDVMLVLHSGDQSKEVVLTKANAQSQENIDAKNIRYQYFYTEVNGRQGVGYVEAKVTPKANIKTTLASMPEEALTMVYGSGPTKAVYENGKFMGEIDKQLITVRSHILPSKMLLEDNGAMVYDSCAKVIVAALSQK